MNPTFAQAVGALPLVPPLSVLVAAIVRLAIGRRDPEVAR